MGKCGLQSLWASNAKWRAKHRPLYTEISADGLADFSHVTLQGIKK